MGELEGVSKGGWRPKVCKWEAGEQDALHAAVFMQGALMLLQDKGSSGQQHSWLHELNHTAGQCVCVERALLANCSSRVEESAAEYKTVRSSVAVGRRLDAGAAAS